MKNPKLPLNLKKSLKGFSIIEILIASTLLAMLGLALSQALTQAITGKRTIEDMSTRFHLARQAMERMSNEISMAYISGHINLSSDPVVLTNFIGEKDKIVFNAFGHVPLSKNAIESDQREISYFLGQDDRTKKPALLRKYHPNNTLKIGEEGPVDTLCTFVKSISFKYWDSTTQQWVENWKTGDNADAKKVLPTRVQIEMVISIDEESDQKFLTQTQIWLDKPIKILS